MGDVVRLITKSELIRSGDAYLRSWRRRDQNMVEARLERVARQLLAGKLKLMGIESVNDAVPKQHTDLHVWLVKNAREPDG